MQPRTNNNNNDSNKNNKMHFNQSNVSPHANQIQNIKSENSKKLIE